MSPQAILERIRRFNLDQRIAQLAGSRWSAVSTAQPRARLSGRLDDLTRLAHAYSEASETLDLAEALAYWYIALRADWAQINLEVQSCLLSDRPVDLRLALIGGIEAQMLTEFADLLRPEDVDRIEDGIFDALNRIGRSSASRD
jgi:hypothetical protein